MSDVVVTINEFAEDGATEGLKAAIVVTMIRLHAQAVSAAPSDKGQLRNSIMWRKGWSSDVFGFPAEGGFNEAGPNKKGNNEQAAVKIEAPNGLEGLVGTAVLHGTYQEFGTRYMKAQPFMRPAADAIRGATAAAIAQKWGREAMQKEFDARKTTRVTR